MTYDPNAIHNAHNLATQLKCPIISVNSHWFKLEWYVGGQRKVATKKRTGPSLYKDKSNEIMTEFEWGELTARAARSLGVSEDSWVPVSGRYASGSWIPKADADRARAMKLRWSGSSTAVIKFGEPGRPCTAVVSTEFVGGSHACGRPAVTHEETGQPGMGAERDGVVHRCKMHENGHQKRIENDRKWREKWDKQDEERKRQEANEARCEEVLEKIRPLLAELGIHPDTLAVGSSGQKVGVLIPAEVAELLTSKAVELEEITGGAF